MNTTFSLCIAFSMWIFCFNALFLYSTNPLTLPLTLPLIPPPSPSPPDRAVPGGGGAEARSAERTAGAVTCPLYTIHMRSQYVS